MPRVMTCTPLAEDRKVRLPVSTVALEGILILTAVFSDQWIKDGWNKMMNKLNAYADKMAGPAPRVKRDDIFDSADAPLFPTGTAPYPTATGAPMPTGTSAPSITERQGPNSASLRRRAKHFYARDLSIDYRLAPKAPSRVVRSPATSAFSIPHNR